VVQINEFRIEGVAKRLECDVKAYFPNFSGDLQAVKFALYDQFTILTFSEKEIIILLRAQTGVAPKFVKVFWLKLTNLGYSNRKQDY
jgi:hypothetical protein